MFKVNLRLKSILITVFLILIPLAFANFYLTFQMQESIKENTMNNLELLAYTTGNEIEKTIEDHINKISVLSNNPVLKDNNASKSDKLIQLNTTQNFYKIFDDITLTDTNGNVIVSTTYNYQDEWKTNQWFQETLQGNITVSDAHVLPSPFKVIMIFLSPVFNDNDEIIGVVSGQIDLKNIWDITDNIKIENTGFVYLINNDEKILAHPNKDLIFSKIDEDEHLSTKMIDDTGSFMHSNENGTDIIYGYSSILGNTIYKNRGSWKLIVAQDSDEVLSNVALLQIQIVYVAILFIIILIIVGFIFSRSFIKPIHKLEKGMQEVSKGNLDHKVQIKSKDELKYLGDSFNKMTKELKSVSEGLKNRTEEVEKLLQQKDEFIGQLGHDLKTPLVPITTLLPKIKNKVDDPELSKYVEIISQNFRYIKDLVINTLKLAEINSSNIELSLEKLNLKELVNEVINYNKILFDKKSINIENNIDYQIDVYVDKLRIKEVCNNLLINSFKFMEQGGSIFVNSKKSNGFVTVSIKDTGIGMTMEQIDNIFNIFYKADPSRHELDSSGLGLSISKRIVEKHNGKIWAESSGIGKGATFYFTLPLNLDE